MGLTLYAGYSMKGFGIADFVPLFRGGVMAKIISFDEVPMPTQTTAHGARRQNNCNHRRLAFDGNLVECRTCGKQWKDYLGESERNRKRKAKQ